MGDLGASTPRPPGRGSIDPVGNWMGKAKNQRTWAALVGSSLEYVRKRLTRTLDPPRIPSNRSPEPLEATGRSLISKRLGEMIYGDGNFALAAHMDLSSPRHRWKAALAGSSLSRAYGDVSGKRRNEIRWRTSSR